MKYFRDAWFYTKTAWENYKASVAIYFIIGIITTSITAAFANGHDKLNAYCKWKPNRFITGIVWVAEYAPRKISCLIWTPFEEERRY